MYERNFFLIFSLWTFEISSHLEDKYAVLCCACGCGNYKITTLFWICHIYIYIHIRAHVRTHTPTHTHTHAHACTHTHTHTHARTHARTHSHTHTHTHTHTKIKFMTQVFLVSSRWKTKKAHFWSFFGSFHLLISVNWVQINFW